MEFLEVIGIGMAFAIGWTIIRGTGWFILVLIGFGSD
jgi:hypothetical protein